RASEKGESRSRWLAPFERSSAVISLMARSIDGHWRALLLDSTRLTSSTPAPPAAPSQGGNESGPVLLGFPPFAKAAYGGRIRIGLGTFAGRLQDGLNVSWFDRALARIAGKSRRPDRSWGRPPSGQVRAIKEIPTFGSRPLSAASTETSNDLPISR